MKRLSRLAAIFVAGALACGEAIAIQTANAARTFFVSATFGNDSYNGLSSQFPWRSLHRVNAADLKPGDTVLLRRGDVWRDTLVPHSGGEGAPITYGAYGNGAKPLLLGSVSRNNLSDWHPEGNNVWTTSAAQLSLDVGNIVFDHGKAVGVKKWRPEELLRQDDYLYCGDARQVKLYSRQNPAELYKSIELALRRHIIDQGNKSHVVYENMSLGYGAAHAIGGGDTHHITVRDCDVGWIGGGHQFTTPQGNPVRFGNGIEFWGNSHDDLVAGCRIWEVYDAALTNQGSSNDAQINITYRDNVIWNCEYSFEYWNRGPESTTRNIVFEHNTCVNAGHGWGHAQRPDPNGRHLMFYVNSAKTTEFRVLSNIFYGATDSCLRMDNDWRAGLEMDRNCWYQTGGVLVRFLNTQFALSQFGDYQARTGLDAHSIAAEPRFINAKQRDFRLREDSPGRSEVGCRRR
jgi:hypothetical protein